MNRRYLFVVYVLLFIVITSTGCEVISSFLNPLTGSWKTGLFNFTFKNDKTFKLEIGSGLSFKTEGSYEYNKEKLFLIFSDNNKTTFNYDLNDNKTELSLTPETEFKWFKTTLKFSKENN